MEHTTNPFFSIIIPALNEERDLPKLLGDIEKQSFKQYEVIVVDGNSTDNTKTEVNKYQKRGKMELYFYIHNAKNVASQRNFGSEKARGQYLVFFDADDQLPQGFLRKLHSNLEKTKVLLATTSLVAKENQQTQIILMELTNFMIDVLNILGKPFAPGFNIIIEKMLFARIGKFDTTLKLAEDHDLIQRARKIGVILKVFKDIYLYPSFRRPEKIGYLEFLRQYTIAGIYTLMGEPIKKDLFKYPMGGHVFDGNGSRSEKNNKLLQSISQTAKSIRKYIELPF
ncbi:MAG: glycosyltransferase [Patescibacteria group bacterium]|jgi:glycosyltransferase involved in cell wall biosynthesis